MLRVIERPEEEGRLEPSNFGASGGCWWHWLAVQCGGSAADGIGSRCGRQCRRLGPFICRDAGVNWRLRCWKGLNRWNSFFNQRLRLCRCRLWNGGWLLNRYRLSLYRNGIGRTVHAIPMSRHRPVTAVPSVTTWAIGCRLDRRRRNVPLSGNGLGWQAVWHRLPERNVLVFIAELGRVRRLVDHWGVRTAIVGTGTIPLVWIVVLVLDSPSLQRIFGWRAISIIG